MTASVKHEKAKDLPGVFVLLAQTLRLYQKNFGILFGYAAWLLLPVAISFFGHISLPESVSKIIEWITMIGFYPIMAIWLSLIIILLTPDIVAGLPPQILTVHSRVRRAIIPFLLTIILVNLLQLVGIIAFIIPGILAGVWFSFATLINVLEGTQVIDSIKQSKALVSPIFFPVLWRLLVGPIVMLSWYVLLVGCVSFIFALLTNIDIATYIQNEPTISQQAIAQIIDVLFLPLFVIYQTIFYLHVREYRVS